MFKGKRFMIKLVETSDEFKEIEKGWYKEVDTLTTQAKFNRFVKKLTSGYEHDFGTSLRALACIVNATIRFYGGGLTNMQASYLMWQIIRTTFGKKDKLGLKLIEFEWLLYPQLLYRFDTIINDETHQKLIELAKEKIVANPKASEEVIEHWKKIMTGWLPDFVKLEKESEA